jgi:flavin-binding protein dodecin
MAVASVSKITAASPTSFQAAVQEGLERANRTLRGITGLHVIEEKASVKNGKIDEYRVRRASKPGHTGGWVDAGEAGW